MKITQEQLAAIAQIALISGLDPHDQERIRKCECPHCRSAAIVLDLAGDMMATLLDAEDAVKN